MAAEPPRHVPYATGPSILLVDDDQDGRDMYDEYLRFKGCRVSVAAGGAEGIAYARTLHPDMILMDLRMPSMTGIEALHTLRADPAFAAVPIVALTAQALNDEQAAARQAGFDAVIAKPCLPEDLFAAIEELLASRRTAGG